uniref:Uncharacterized protein n=1 Tax=Schistocephalus solidus TaxID=70667 RepID=A0A0X3PTZ7_SCHSO
MPTPTYLYLHVRRKFWCFPERVAFLYERRYFYFNLLTHTPPPPGQLFEARTPTIPIINQFLLLYLADLRHHFPFSRLPLCWSAAHEFLLPLNPTVLQELVIASVCFESSRDKQSSEHSDLSYPFFPLPISL